MNNKSLGLVLVAILLCVFGFEMIQIGKQQQIAQQHQAYNVCLAAHEEISGNSETACANAQDATHTEFLCDKTNTYCWLEVK
jgi:hypothetical protein